MPALLRRKSLIGRLRVHEDTDRFGLVCPDGEPELAAAPQHILRRHGPFPIHQIAQFGLIQPATEMPAEIAARAREAEN